MNLVKVKDAFLKGLRTRVVYKFSRASCNACYVGETSRHFRTRVREHLFLDRSSHVLRRLQSSESCRTSSSPDEFYKTFWKDVSSLLVSALNYAFESGCLSITQRRGIIKLIPKKDAELYFIKNWRPITLLNTDYKIAAKALANRIKSVLPSLINNDQTGFMKGRFIGENVRLIDCIQYAAEKNIPGLLLFIDFEKAFDSLEWSFIVKSLHFFGFGPSKSGEEVGRSTRLQLVFILHFFRALVTSLRAISQNKAPFWLFLSVNYIV